MVRRIAISERAGNYARLLSSVTKNALPGEHLPQPLQAFGLPESHANAEADEMLRRPQVKRFPGFKFYA